MHVTNIVQVVQKLGGSATWMTWLNLAARVCSTVLILPLIVRHLDTAEVVVYYLIISGAGFVTLSCSGFGPTITRFVSYSLVSRRVDLEASDRESILGIGEVRELLFTMRAVYIAIGLIAVPVMLFVGYLVLKKPVSGMHVEAHGWISWCIVVGSIPFVLLSALYSAVIQGADAVAVDQRWAALFSLMAAISACAILLLGGGLIGLVASMQIWQVIGYIRLKYVAASVLPQIGESSCCGVSRELFMRVLGPSWRSLVGVVSYNGVTSAIGFGMAQFLDARPLAELLFSLRVMGIGTEAAKAPFYSKIPLFNVLRIRGDRRVLMDAARKSMNTAYMVLIIFISVVAVFGNDALSFIGSSVLVAEQKAWFLLGLAMLLERNGAMHLQIYTTTNVVIWHWVNGLLGCAWIALLCVFAWLGSSNSYSLSLVIALVCTYVPISVAHSLVSLKCDYWSFERTSFVPFLLVYCSIALLIVFFK